jgi:predicted transcriptional regulator
MEQTHASMHLYECTTCGNLGFGHGEITCCEREMTEVTDEDPRVTQPTLPAMLRTVFDMSETELDICLCVMAGGEQTVADLAEQVEYDRSVVNRHLNHLVELGVIEKRRRLLKDGGHVYIYTPNDPAIVRQRLRGTFVSWVERALPLLESLSREKVEAIVETDAENPQWKIYRE